MCVHLFYSTFINYCKGKITFFITKVILYYVFKVTTYYIIFVCFLSHTNGCERTQTPTLVVPFV